MYLWLYRRHFRVNIVFDIFLPSAVRHCWADKGVREKYTTTKINKYKFSENGTMQAPAPACPPPLHLWLLRCKESIKENAAGCGSGGTSWTFNFKLLPWMKGALLQCERLTCQHTLFGEHFSKVFDHYYLFTSFISVTLKAKLKNSVKNVNIFRGEIWFTKRP